jgi:basic amino acid/polyamine antiporter, APA family
MSSLLRKLGAVDLVLITIGAVIGSGIFRNPAAVAARAHQPPLILGCWIAGGVLAMIGAFVFAELAARRPLGGGQYAYLREAYHPAVGFMYGWTLMVISDTGGTAASAVLFAGYFEPLTGLHLNPQGVGVVTIAVITLINLLGVRQGATWQNILVGLKVTAIGALIVAGFVAHPIATVTAALPGFTSTPSLLAALGVAMLPVLFSYNGFQGASFVAAETIDPARTIPRGVVLGVATIITVYLLVNIGALRVLGAAGLAATSAPASDVMQAAFGSNGAHLIAIAIALSTLGFISTRILIAPRIYFQMAQDGYFFKQVATVSARTKVPTIAILLQGLFAIIIVVAATGNYEHIVNWVVAPEWAFIALAAGAVFIFRARDKGGPEPLSRVPGHPFTTGIFLATLIGVFVAEIVTYPLDALVGGTVMASGIVFFFGWRRFQNSHNG